MSDDAFRPKLPQVTLPLGIALDLLQTREPGMTRDERQAVGGSRNVGLHLEADFLDVGRYLTETNLSGDGADVLWNDILVPALNVDAVFARSLLFGVSVRYLPYDSVPQVEAGLTLGWYVPLLDLN